MKKKNRVRKAQEFQSLIHTAKKSTNESFVMYFADKKEKEARIGITLSKKMGKAVERNLIKRQVRMMCQELTDFSSYPKDVILIVRYGYKNHSYTANKNNLEKLLLKATII
ncbi:MAG: ribonuclease P protein component [Solobacterium sp.]|nr:ribonuclease P protein component [Solobacterium sp.]